MPFSFDTSKPADNDIVSQYPANERTLRVTLDNCVGTEHDVASGRHKIASGSTAARDGITNWVAGSVFVNTSYTAPRLQMQTAASSPFVWIDLGSSVVPTGTIAPFYQSTAPSDWTRLTGVANDRVIMLTDSTAGGTNASSWPVSGLTHAHYHVVTASATTGTAFDDIHDGASGSGTIAHSGHKHNFAFSVNSNAASTSAVSSDGTWRPPAAMFLLAQRNA